MTMRKHWVAIGLALALLLSAAGGHALSQAEYEERYAQISAEYGRIRYGDTNEDIIPIKERLKELGYYAYNVNDRFHRTLEIALRVFCQQMGLEGDGRELTPLLQAILRNEPDLPAAISPQIDTSLYSYEPDGMTYTPYTYARLMRESVREQASVGFEGQIVQVAGGVDEPYLYAVQMEEDPEQIVYVSYQPLPRTTAFQAGDRVAVFGVTQGLTAVAQMGTETQRLSVAADRVGFLP